MKKILETGEQKEPFSIDLATEENGNTHELPGNLSEQQSAVTEDERIADHAVASEVRLLKKAKHEPDTVPSCNIDNGKVYFNSTCQCCQK